MKREIIVGFDPQHGGRDVLALGRLLSEVLDAKPLVVTVMPWPQLLMGVKGAEETLAAQMDRRFAVVYREMDDLEVETRMIASDSPAAALSEVAETDSAHLIVVGSSHHGPVGRTLAGSVGESLLHGARRAVVIAPRDYADREHSRLKRIAVAFDGSPESWTALETGIALAERCNGQLSVLTAADYPRYGYATALELIATGDLEDAEQKEKERLLKLAISRVPTRHEAASRVLTGDPADVLGRASGEFDLLITGSRSWGPLKRTMLGSTTRKLVRRASCPVLVLPRGVGMDPLGVREPGHSAAAATH